IARPVYLLSVFDKEPRSERLRRSSKKIKTAVTSQIAKVHHNTNRDDSCPSLRAIRKTASVVRTQPVTAPQRHCSTPSSKCRSARRTRPIPSKALPERKSNASIRSSSSEFPLYLWERVRVRA